ncbi:DUF397 domain-containing protein [Streptomyces sp. NPDC088357]|uniref:DUF397 domain-containing protein n=1 Tax=Streptomyces sp. NPDC088357 TaxID=3154655 RepID=UPI0034427F1A
MGAGRGEWGDRSGADDRADLGSDDRGSEQGGACLEVATSPHAIYIRDSKHTTGPTLNVSRDTWTAFLPLTRHR